MWACGAVRACPPTRSPSCSPRPPAHTPPHTHCSYFGLLSACAALMLGVLLAAARAPPRRELVLLAIGLATSAANWLVMEPLVG